MTRLCKEARATLNVLNRSIRRIRSSKSRNSNISENRTRSRRSRSNRSGSISRSTSRIKKNILIILNLKYLF